MLLMLSLGRTQIFGRYTLLRLILLRLEMPSAVLSPQQSLADFLRLLAASSSFETAHQVDAHYFIQKSPWQRCRPVRESTRDFLLESGVVRVQVPMTSILKTVTTSNYVLLFLLDR
jgi:hypothetical protein